MQNIEDTVRKVLRKSNSATLKELHSFFAGSYTDMCLVADALYGRGCGFLYDPRNLDIRTECLGESMWYRISMLSKVITEGFEMISHEMDDEEMLRLLEERWEKLEKPEAEANSDIRRMCSLMRYPRDIILKGDEIGAFDLRNIPEEFVKEEGDSVRIKGELMTRYSIISEFPEKVMKDGKEYRLMHDGLYEPVLKGAMPSTGEGVPTRITLSLNEAESLVY